MSDGGTWQPPDPASSPPPPPPAARPASPVPPVPPSMPPTQTIPVAGPAAPKRSRGKVIGAAVGAAAIVGAGVFGITRLAGDGGSGGASTPEDAGRAFVEAIGNEDVLALVDVLLPGERQAFRGPLVDLVDELRRLEVLSEEADPSAVAGFDLTVEDVSVDTEATNVPDIVDLSIDATITGSIDGEALPLGDWVRDEVGDLSRLDSSSDEDTSASGGELGLAAVEEDGRWYISAFHSLAENARIEAGEPAIPEEGVEPVGGDSPEGAIDVMFDAIADLDVEAAIAALDPGEAQALQRYAPLFLADAQADVDEAPFEWSITDREYRVEGSGSTRSVFVEAFTVEIESEGETATLALRDGCLVLSAPGQEQSSCDPLDDIPELEEAFGDDAEVVEDLLADVQSTFEDYEAPGVQVREVDGSWYVSPIGTLTEQLLAVSRALSREEIEGLRDAYVEYLELLTERAYESYSELDDSEPIPPSTFPEGTSPPDPADECWALADAAEAAPCFQALVDDGSIDPYEMPWYLRHPECGLADVGWSGDYYGLPDTEFVAVVEEAAPCFQELVASGEIDEFDLPTEMRSPECLAGRNWYEATDEEYLRQFEDCAYD